MATPVFLELDHTLRLHHSLIEHYGGIEGTRDVGLFHSAIVFLALNGVEIDNDEQGSVDLTLSVTAGEAGKTEIAEFFRARVQTSPDD